MSAPAWSLGVLAGGRSTRMGRDKASLPFRGATLLEHAIARFGRPGIPVLVSTQPESGFVPEGAVRVADVESGLGPLAGMARLLASCPTDSMLVLPTDLPLFPPDCAQALLGALGGHEAAFFSWNGRVEPFPVLVRHALGPLLEDLLRRGMRRADAFHVHAVCRTLPFSESFPGVDPAIAFTNVNTPEELARAEALARGERPLRGDAEV